MDRLKQIVLVIALAVLSSVFVTSCARAKESTIAIRRANKY